MIADELAFREIHTQNVNSLIAKLRIFDAESLDDSDIRELQRVEMISAHNRLWYGLLDEADPSDHALLHLTDSLRPSYSVIRGLAQYAAALFPSTTNGEFNVFQRYGIQIDELLTLPEEFLLMIIRIREEEIAARKRSENQRG